MTSERCTFCRWLRMSVREVGPDTWRWKFCCRNCPTVIEFTTGYPPEGIAFDLPKRQRPELAMRC